jgi:hypothetical protein
MDAQREARSGLAMGEGNWDTLSGCALVNPGRELRVSLAGSLWHWLALAGTGWHWLAPSLDWPNRGVTGRGQANTL